MADGVKIRIVGDDSDFRKKMQGVGTVAQQGFKVAAAAAVTFGAVAVKQITDLAAETREYRENLARLEAAFTTAGFTSEQATAIYKDFYAVLGEEDRSVEAVNHLAQLCDTEEQLNKWTTICTGVVATFGDSLPIEGLTEAANETAKVGQVTGPLADALNWAGVSEDEFNKKLAACTSEQERQALITETLNGIYEDAANKYREINASVMDANRAQSDYQDTLAALGETVEPIMTALKIGWTGVLDSMLALFDGVDIQGYAEDIVSLFDSFKTDGAITSIDQFANHLGEVLSGILTVVAGKLPQFTSLVFQIVEGLISGIKNNLPQITEAAVGISTTLISGMIQMLPNILQLGMELLLELANGITAALPNLIEIAVGVILQIVETLLLNIDLIVEVATTLIVALAEGLISAIPLLIERMPEIIIALVGALIACIPMLLQAGFDMLAAIGQGFFGAFVTVFATIGETIYTYIIAPILAKLSEMFTSLVSMFSEAWANIQAIWGVVVSFFSAIWEGIKLVFSKVRDWFADKFGTAWAAIKNAWNAAKSFFSNIWEGIKSIFVGENGVVSRFKQWFSDAFDKVKEFFSLDNFKKVFEDSIIGGLENIKDAVEKKAGEIWDKISGVLKKPFEFLFDWGGEGGSGGGGGYGGIGNIVAYGPGISFPKLSGFSGPNSHRNGNRRAMDYPAPMGTPIPAIIPGEIVSVRSLNYSYGKHVVIQGMDGKRYVYAHMSRFANIKPGMMVPRGKIIGYVGSTGNSSGPHLHYGLMGYQSGGFPFPGELFVANENGIEMMGKMGSRNVVANNMQIIDGIKNGVFSGMVRAARARGISNYRTNNVTINQHFYKENVSPSDTKRAARKAVKIGLVGGKT